MSHRDLIRSSFSEGLQALLSVPPTLTMLTTIPEEIREAIVVQCAAIDPGSLASLAQTDSSLHRWICKPEGQYLWRSIYLEIFDDPRHALSLHNGTLFEAQSFDWKAQAQRIFRAVFRLRKAEFYEKEIGYYVDEDASEAILLVAHLALPCTSDKDLTPSKNETWLNKTLSAVVLPPPTNQAYARLHILACFLSTVNFTTLPLASVSAPPPSRLPSRAFLYDLANYTEESGYGPWLPDGTMRVNWQHLWHAINVIRYNIQERSGRNIAPGHQFTNFCANSAYTDDRPLPETEEITTKVNDWAGVNGFYTRAISFMDYRDLYAYNVSETRNTLAPSLSPLLSKAELIMVAAQHTLRRAAVANEHI